MSPIAQGSNANQYNSWSVKLCCGFLMNKCRILGIPNYSSACIILLNDILEFWGNVNLYD